jgi:hypothetical protein
MEQEKEVIEQRHRKKNRWWILLLLLLLVIGLAGGYYFYTKENEKGRLARDEDALGGMLPGKTDEEIQELLNQKVQEGMVNIGIQAEPIFEYGGKKGKLGIENIQGNNYSFQVNLLLDDTDEQIYESGLIDPGYYVDFVSLNKTLEAGSYNATAVFTTYSLDESEDAIATTNIKLLLHIKDGSFY